MLILYKYGILEDINTQIVSYLLFIAISDGMSKSADNYKSVYVIKYWRRLVELEKIMREVVFI